MNRKYRIPDFNIKDLIQALYSTEIHDTGTALYTVCCLGSHSNQPRKGDLRLYDDGTWGAWVCHKHGRGSVWDLLEQYHNLPGWSDRDSAAFDDTILFVCEVLGINPELRKNATFDTKDITRELYRDLLKSLDPISFKKENEHYFRDPETNELLYRGITPFVWLSHDVGMIPPKRLKELRKKYKGKDWKAAGLGFGAKYDWIEWISQGVAIIRRNKNNIPVGIAVRRYEEMAGDLGHAKYMKNRNHDLFESSAFLFNYREALRAPEPAVYIVEGEFDAKALAIRGLPSVVTWGSGLPSKDQIDRIQEIGKQVIMLPDTDPNGEGFRLAHEIAVQMDTANFVFLPTESEDEKIDADIFVDQYGVEALRQLSSYTALMVCMASEEIGEDGRWHLNVEALLEKYLMYIADNPSPRDEDNINYVAEMSGYNLAGLWEYVRTVRNNYLLEQVASSSAALTIQVSQ